MPQPASIKRLPWMRRIQFYSPKAARMLVLFSYDAVATWALAESSPLVEAFCEYPGFVPFDGARTLADFWVRGAGREQFIKIEGGIDLTPESAERVKTPTCLPIPNCARPRLLPGPTPQLTSRPGTARGRCHLARSTGRTFRPQPSLTCPGDSAV